MEAQGRKMSNPAKATMPLNAIIGTECRPSNRMAAASQLEMQNAAMRLMMELRTRESPLSLGIAVASTLVRRASAFNRVAQTARKMVPHAISRERVSRRFARSRKGKPTT